MNIAERYSFKDFDAVESLKKYSDMVNRFRVNFRFRGLCTHLILG